MSGQLTLLLGGVRSGKSSYAESWARDNGRRVLFVATAQAHDDEMRARIDAHRATRPLAWHTLEAPNRTGEVIQATIEGETFDTVVVDCMTMLASNAMIALPEAHTIEQAVDAVVLETERLLSAQRQSSARWLIVTNEVGMGVVPPSQLGREYRDALGRANQMLAGAADEVLLFVAGLPWRLKP